MATYTRPHRTRASDLEPEWHVLDAEGKTLGRLSTEVAVLLQGKHRPTYVPYLNTGDFVVVVNAEKIRVTGNKLKQKIYYRHSGYHGGLKEETLGDLLERAPTRALKRAVKGMLPKNTVGRRMLSRLKLYTGDSHPHAAQLNARPKPKVVEEPPAPAAEEKLRRRRAAAKAAAPEVEAAAPAVEATAEVAAPEVEAAVETETAAPEVEATADAETAEPEAKEKPKPRRRRTAAKAEAPETEAVAPEEPKES